MRVRAFAKINLSLRVLGLRGDGFHELRTTFQSIALHDTLTIRRHRGPFVLTCDDPQLPVDGTNLIVRAARELWKASGHQGAPRGVRIDLAKQIPIAAGLGGGSSDAAAALRGLGKLWRVEEARLRSIASRLGADVPYFFEGGTALGAGRGDEIVPSRDEKSAWAVLVLPGFGVSTAEAYAWWDADRRRAGRGPKRAALHGPRATVVARAFQARDRRNDLQAPVARRHPEIRRLVAALRRAGASQAMMSGSGSTVFGLFSSRSAATAAARAVANRGTRTLVTRTLSRAAYRRLTLAAN